MKYAHVCIALIALIGPAACKHPFPDSSGLGEGRAAQSSPPTAWDAAAVQTAEELAAKIRAAGTMCDEFEVSPFEAFGAEYRIKVPLAAAIATCVSADDEDLTFEVFADAQHARAFVDAKLAYLCPRRAELLIPQFPGFPYVDGGAWIIEPDEQETAEELAPIVGGEAKKASCDTKQ